MKRIYLTIGDPRGIGAQIIVKSLAEIKADSNYGFQPVIVGDEKVIENAASG
jgi:4-hydroxy-L-threonine phosphate dehydrogenase PdxA